jgi:hypothetical protein
VRAALFWVITQRVPAILTDVSGQPIGPIFKGQEFCIFFISLYFKVLYWYPDEGRYWPKHVAVLNKENKWLRSTEKRRFSYRGISV